MILLKERPQIIKKQIKNKLVLNNDMPIWYVIGAEYRKSYVSKIKQDRILIPKENLIPVFIILTILASSFLNSSNTFFIGKTSQSLNISTNIMLT